MDFSVFFKAIVALGFWAFILHVRLFRKFYDLIFFTETFKETKSLFQSLFIITLFATLVSIIALYLEYKRKKTPSTFLSWFQKKFSLIFRLLKHFEEGKITLYDFFFKCLGKYQDYLVSGTYLFIKHYKKAKIIIFGGIIISRLIIIICLITEIYFCHLKYYFYSLLLLILYLIIQLIIFILNDIGRRYIPILGRYIMIDEEQAIKAHKAKEPYLVQFKPEYAYGDIQYFSKYFLTPIMQIPFLMKNDFLPLYRKINLFTFICFFGIQACCWYYILTFYF